MTNVRSSSFVSLGALLVAFSTTSGTVLFGCGSADRTPDPVVTPSGPGAGSGAPQKASIRLVHASPDAPAVDVYAKGASTPLAKGLAYGDTSAYIELDPGTYALELRASPSTASDPVAYATDAMLMTEGERVTAIAAGLLGSESDGDKFRVLALEEAFASPGSNNAIVRVVHAGADAPTVGLDLGNDDPTSPEVTGLDRFTDTGTAGLPMTAGRANAIGITANGARVTAFTTPDLPEGAELFVIATGLTKKLAREADGFALLAVGPEGTIGFVKQDPIVYALHASPDAPTVDAFVGDKELVDGIAFGGLSQPVQVPPGAYALDFFAHEAGSTRPATPPATTASTGKLAAGERYLAIATGFLAPAVGQESFRLVASPEGFALDDATNARIRLVHASPDAPVVDIGEINVAKVVPPVMVPSLAFGGASGAPGLSIAPATTPFGVAPAGQDATVVAAFHVPATAGQRAFAVVAGALDPTRGQPLRLLVVDTGTSPWNTWAIQPQPQN